MKLTTVALIAVCAFALFSVAESKDWAVLVAGSNGFWNYRHQADIAHAYQIVKKGGIDPSRIITLVYNDIANDTSNPFPGQIFNKPTAAGVPGVDVYKGFVADYSGDQVTAQTFMDVITGTGTGKVLKSTASDNVFIYFSDHGTTGAIAFPVGDLLSVTQLQNSLKQMQTKKMYKKLVFYLEACESGSMFAGWLPTNMGIYATTAANPDESSWGWYCSPDDMINGKEIGSCLGDEYSITWLESIDTLGMKQTLQANFLYVQNHTTKSHVMQYGDVSFSSDSMGTFLTDTKSNRNLIGLPAPVGPAPAKAGSKVNSRDIKLNYMYNKYTKAVEGKRTAEQQFADGVELLREVQHRLNEDLKFRALASSLVGEEKGKLMHTASTTRPAIECGGCCEEAYKVVQTQCGGFSDYSLKYGRTIHNLCNSSPEIAAKVPSRLAEICKNPVTVSV